MATDRYQRGLDRMMELVSPEHANTFDHAKLVESYKSLDPDLADYIVSFAFGDIYSPQISTTRSKRRSLRRVSGWALVPQTTELDGGGGRAVHMTSDCSS